MVRTLRVIPASVFCSSVVASLAACLAESSLGAGVVGVRLRELVALWAVRLRGIGCSQCLPSHQVLAWCHHLKMGRIHAVMTTAQVIDLFTFGYLSTDKLITESVSGHTAAVLPEPAIALLAGASFPQPAGRCRRDFREESASIHMFSIAQYRHGEP